MESPTNFECRVTDGEVLISFDATTIRLPLPEAICAEVHRVANRREITVEAARSDPQTLPASIMAEAPIYRGGEQLQPWQRSFVTLFMEHAKTYGKARLLLADEVGVGKTLSMATSALVSAVMDEKPVLVLAPSTLTLQWQIEMKDRLGADLTSTVGVHRAAPASADVLHALLALGYSDKEAVAAVKDLPEGVAVADGIRQSLKRLAKA